MAISHTSKIRQKRATTRRVRTRTNTTTEQRKLSSARASARRLLWTKDVAKERARQDEEVQIIAKTHGMSLVVAKARIQQLSCQKGRRAVSAYNAWIHCKSIEVNEGTYFLHANELLRKLNF